ncbi:hypothetical protein V8O11_14735 [Erwinia aphidicola]|uniref:hypothetical protein n=1 Tax=Erwinia aphidicola TaxID=68334 RepID=UPI00300CF886
MKKTVLTILALTAVVQFPAHAITEKYRQQLERSGCTQQSELQGCDIHKTKAQNDRAGFGNKNNVSAESGSGLMAFAGNYVASLKDGKKIADIHIENNAVYVDGKEISDINHVGNVLTFKKGYIVYSLYLNDKVKNSWMDTDSGNDGPVRAE